jgi:hypothetical protein
MDLVQARTINARMVRNVGWDELVRLCLEQFLTLTLLPAFWFVGINYNDGFGGGNTFEGNAVWNMVREVRTLVTS